MKITEKEWVERANKIHKGKYDYSKIIYKGSKEKVCIICPKHGEFWQEANSHLRGCKCPKCSYEEQCYKDVNDFITKSNKIHNFKYDYSKVKYQNNNTKVCIICPEHGEFWQMPYLHTKCSGCPCCAKNHKLNREDFIEKAKKK